MLSVQAVSGSARLAARLSHSQAVFSLAALASDLVRLDEFVDVARDKSDEFPEFHVWDSPGFNVVIQGPQGHL
jgi:hypothetical protein